ncbi:unnamed protein product, partial [Notodromas monacha]
FAPTTGDYNLASKLSFAHDYVAATLETDVFRAKTLSGGVVVGSQASGVSAGVAAVYGMEKRRTERLQYGLAYDTPTLSGFATLLNGREAIAGLHLRVSDCLEAGVALKHEFQDDQQQQQDSGGGGASTVGVGMRIAVDANTMVGAKLDTNGTLGTCYEQKIGPSVTLTFSSAVDLGKLDSGAHKLGLGIALET